RPDVEPLGDGSKRQRLVEPQAEHHSLRTSHRFRERLDLAQGSLALAERLEVGPQPRRCPPADSVHRRDRPDPEAEVVTPLPVGEVVPRTKITAFRGGGRATEVRGLVPAVTGADEGLDDTREVGLHRLRLALKLFAV